jgi:hypothetical protein
MQVFEQLFSKKISFQTLPESDRIAAATLFHHKGTKNN